MPLSTQELRFFKYVDSVNPITPEGGNDALADIPKDIRAQVQSLVCLHELNPTSGEFMHREGGVEYKDEIPSRAFKYLDRALGEFFIEQIRRILPKDSPLFSILEPIFSRGDWKGVPEGSAIQIILFGLYAKMQRLRGALVREYVLESPVAKERLNPVARLEYEHFGEIADATNAFYIEWYQDAGSILDTDERQKRGFTNELATIRMVNGEYREVLWHEAFPKYTNRLAFLYVDLANSLNRLYDERVRESGGIDHLTAEERNLFERKIEYYTALAKAFKSSDIEAWRIADALLPGQTAGQAVPIHIHTIEVGYEPDRIQRDPEASLRCPDEDFSAVNERALEIRARILETMRKFFEHAGSGYSNTVKSTKGLVARSNFAARHFMGSGMEMTFKPVGQILPNETESRVEGGIDISADPVTAKNRHRLTVEAFQAVFPDFQAPDSFLSFDPVEAVGDRTASHEFAHAIGLSKSLEARIPDPQLNPYIEEWKATDGGMVFAEFLHFQALNGNPNTERAVLADAKENLRRSTLYHIAQGCRYASMRQQPSVHAYVRKSFMIMNAAVETGLVKKISDDWTPDLSDEVVLAFYKALYADYRQVLQIYDTGEIKDLKQFLDRRLQPTELLEFIARRVDTHFGKTDMPTVAELCKFESS